jgi:homogentisate 1,2-dioxygenase
MERSIGHKETHELAVMVDTFRTLMVTEEAMELMGEYYKSWVESLYGTTQTHLVYQFKWSFFLLFVTNEVH